MPKLVQGLSGNVFAGILPSPLASFKVQAGTRWVWDGYIPRGGTALLTSPWKLGKSTLLAALLAQMGADGGDLNGRVSPARVLLLSEETQDTWARRRERFGIRAPIHAVCRGEFKTRPTLRQWPDFIAWLVHHVEAGKFDLVVLDTLLSYLPVPNENDAAMMMDALMPLLQITERGASLLLLHHATKVERSERTSARGSGALSGWADELIDLREFGAPGGCQRKLTVYGRAESHPPAAILELVDDCRYIVRGTAKAVQREARLSRVHRYLPTEPPGYSLREVLDAWDETESGPAPSVRTLKRALRADTRVTEVRGTRGGRGTVRNPSRYWLAVTGYGTGGPEPLTVPD